MKVYSKNIYPYIKCFKNNVNLYFFVKKKETALLLFKKYYLLNKSQF